MNVSYINRLFYSRGFLYKQTYFKPFLNIHHYPWGMKYKKDSSDPQLLKEKEQRNKNALAIQNAEANADTREVGASSKKLIFGPTKVKEVKKSSEGQKGDGLSVEENFGVAFYSSEDEEMSEEFSMDYMNNTKKRKIEQEEIQAAKKQKTDLDTSSDSDSSADFYFID